MTLRDELLVAPDDVVVRRLADYGEEDLGALIYEAGRRRLRASVDHLRSLLVHPDDHVKQAVVEALGEIGDDRAAPDILALAKRENLTLPLRNTIPWALGSLRHRPAVLTLTHMLQDPEPTVRSCSAAALAALNDPIAVPALSLALARETDASVRTELHAVRTLLAWEVLKRDQVPPS